jgi:hypothetical protein
MTVSTTARRMDFVLKALGTTGEFKKVSDTS